MTLEYKQSLTELNTILNCMNMEYFKKIPQKFINFIQDNMDNTYKPDISKDIPIDQQNLKKDTRILLSLLYRNYWCDDETKNRLLKEDLLVKKEYDNKLKEKYNQDNLFKKNLEFKDKISIKEKENVTSLVEYKKTTWYKRLFNKILSIFKLSTALRLTIQPNPS